MKKVLLLACVWTVGLWARTEYTWALKNDTNEAIKVVFNALGRQTPYNYTLKPGEDYALVTQWCIKDLSLASSSGLKAELEAPNNTCSSYSVVISKNNGRLYTNIIGKTMSSLTA